MNQTGNTIQAYTTFAPSNIYENINDNGFLPRTHIGLPINDLQPYSFVSFPSQDAIPQTKINYGFKRAQTMYDTHKPTLCPIQPPQETYKQFYIQQGIVNQKFNSPVNRSRVNEQTPVKVNLSVKSKLFRQLSNKQNQEQESSSRFKYVSKTSIKKEVIPTKIQFDMQSNKKKYRVDPFKLSQQNSSSAFQFSITAKEQQSKRVYNNIDQSPFNLSIQIPSYQPQIENYGQLSISYNNLIDNTNDIDLVSKYSVIDNSFSMSYLGQSLGPSFSVDENWKQRPSFSEFDCSKFDLEEFRSPRNSLEYNSYLPTEQSIVNPRVVLNQQIDQFWNSNSQNEQIQKDNNQQQNIYQYKSPELKDFIKGKRLGKGMYGEVFVVTHQQTGFICALKVISKEFVRTQKVTEQLVQQLKIHMHMDHPNVVAVYGFFSDAQNVYILQELCTGGQLFDILVRRRRISQKKTAYYAKQMIEGIGYIHSKQVVHRDIKPENILLQFGVVKIGDFGWAAYSSDNQYIDKCGTPLYLSPQVIRGGKYSRIADNWGIGLICFELIIGNIPWSVWTEQQIIKIAQQDLVFPQFVHVSNTAKDFIERVLTKYPCNRLSIEEMRTHSFLTPTSLFEYHNQQLGNYGQTTP